MSIMFNCHLVSSSFLSCNKVKFNYLLERYFVNFQFTADLTSSLELS